VALLYGLRLVFIAWRAPKIRPVAFALTVSLLVGVNLFQYARIEDDRRLAETVGNALQIESVLLPVEAYSQTGPNIGRKSAESFATELVSLRQLKTNWGPKIHGLQAMRRRFQARPGDSW